MARTTPKTNWAVGELVTAEEMNAIGENLAMLRHPATAVAAYTTTEDTRARAADFTDVDSNNLNLTITTAGGDVLVHFDGSVPCGQGQYGHFDVEANGTRQGGDNGLTQFALRTYKNIGHSMKESVSFT